MSIFWLRIAIAKSDYYMGATASTSPPGPQVSYQPSTKYVRPALWSPSEPYRSVGRRGILHCCRTNQQARLLQAKRLFPMSHSHWTRDNREMKMYGTTDPSPLQSEIRETKSGYWDVQTSLRTRPDTRTTSWVCLAWSWATLGKSKAVSPHEEKRKEFRGLYMWGVGTSWLRAGWIFHWFVGAR